MKPGKYQGTGAGIGQEVQELKTDEIKARKRFISTIVFWDVDGFLIRQWKCVRAWRFFRKSTSIVSGNLLYGKGTDVRSESQAMSLLLGEATTSVMEAFFQGSFVRASCHLCTSA